MQMKPPLLQVVARSKSGLQEPSDRRVQLARPIIVDHVSGTLYYRMLGQLEQALPAF